jgi:Na+/melibiose symporter-like transporter
MFDQSVVVKSGQGWKALTVVGGSIVSAVCFFAGLALLGGKQPAIAVWLVLLGIGMFACSMLFACAFIRCPHCGTRWVWLAVTRSDAVEWVSSVMSQGVCRACGR